MTRRARCASLALLTILALATQAAAARRAADARIAAGDLLEPVRPVRVIANIAFTPSAAGSPRGLATGEKLKFGESSYRNAFWIEPFKSSQGCTLYYPRMIGWGANIVALLPHGVTGIRLAKSAGAKDNADLDSSGMAQVAEALVKFCDNGTGDPLDEPKMRHP